MRRHLPLTFWIYALLGFGITAAASDHLESIPVFENGKNGFPIYRIPALVCTPNGTLVACCEARPDADDWSAARITMRRSTDGGTTWSESRVAAEVKGPVEENPAAVARKRDRPGTLYNNPVLIAGGKPGVVHLLFCVEYARCFYQRSEDDGATFSKPAEITGAFEEFRKRYPWQVLATGPGHGIRLKSGRLVVPVWLSRGTVGNAHRPSAVSTVYSDDDGATWHAGEIVAGETDPLTNPNESAAVELVDGRVMLNIRNESPPNRRAFAISPDGATKWTRPSFDDALPEPICMAGLARTRGGAVLFCNPDSKTANGQLAGPGKKSDRRNLTVRLSDDDGKTWKASRVIDPGPSAYCDLAVSPDGMIYCLYETGNGGGAAAGIVLVKFDERWLRAGSPRE